MAKRSHLCSPQKVPKPPLHIVRFYCLLKKIRWLRMRDLDAFRGMLPLPLISDLLCLFLLHDYFCSSAIKMTFDQDVSFLSFVGAQSNFTSCFAVRMQIDRIMWVLKTILCFSVLCSQTNWKLKEQFLKTHLCWLLSKYLILKECRVVYYCLTLLKG